MNRCLLLFLVACASQPSANVRITFDRSALTGVQAQLTAVVNTTCNGASVSQTVAFDGDAVSFSAPPCEAATLALALMADDIVAFEDSETAQLVAGQTADVTFTGKLRGEIALSSNRAAHCELGDQATDVAADGALVKIALPVGSYAVSCASDFGSMQLSTTVVAGVRTALPFAFSAPVSAPRSTVSSLRALYLNGQLVAGFDPAVKAYTIDLPAQAPTVRIDVTTTDATASVVIGATGSTSLTVDVPGVETSVQVVVTAEDGVTSTAYTLTLRRGAFQLMAFGTTGFVFEESRGNGVDFDAYVTVDASQVAISAFCDQACPLLTADFGGTAYVLGTPLTVPFGASTLTFSGSDPVSGMPSQRTFHILRVGLSALRFIDFESLTPLPTAPFDPAVTSYNAFTFALAVAATGTVDPRVQLETTVRGALPANNNVDGYVVTVVNSPTTVLATYTAHVDHARVMIADYYVSDDTFTTGHVTPLNPVGNIFDPADAAPVTARPAIPITAMKQHPGAPIVYMVHADGTTGADAASVMTIDFAPGGAGPSEAMTFRTIGGTGTTLSLGNIEPEQIVFHPTLPYLYTRSVLDGRIYKVDLSGNFDGVTGNPGLPVSQSNFGAGAFHPGESARLLMSPDGLHLYEIAPGPTGAFIAQTINTTTGDFASGGTETAIAANTHDAVLSRDGTMLIVGDGIGLTRYPITLATGVLGAGVDQAQGAVSQLEAHPGLDVVYGAIGQNIVAFTYTDVATPMPSISTFDVSSASTSPVTALAIDPHGYELYMLFDNGTSCGNGSTFIDPVTGAITAPHGNVFAACVKPRVAGAFSWP